MISILMAIWDGLKWFKNITVNWAVGKGWRWSGGSLVFTIATSIYTFMAWMVSTMFNAVQQLITDLPQAVGDVSDALTASKSGMASTGALAGNFLSMVNYILPLDFLASCLCIYFSVWVTCWLVGLMFKFFDFLSDVNPIG